MTHNELTKAMRDSKQTFFGVRADREGITAGTQLERSHGWDHVLDQSSEELLNGTCCIMLCEDSDLADEEFDMGGALERAMKLAGNYGWDRYYIIGGNAREWGEDDGEWIISDATCLEYFGAIVIAAIE